MFNPIVKLVPVFIDRIKNEYEAHYFYTNSGNYFANAGFDKLAEFCRKEAADELTHAMILQDYLNDWGVSYVVPVIELGAKITGVQDFLNKAYGTYEVPLYKAYDANCGIAFNVDKSAFALFQKMVDIQYESVAEYKTYLDKLALYGTDKLSIKIFEDEVFG